MLHNYLRNFTSHELVVHFNASNQTYHCTDSIDKLRSGIEVACYLLCGLVDARKTVALRKGGNGSQKQDRRKE